MTRGHLPIGWGVRVMLALRSLAGGNGPCPSVRRSLDLRRWRLRPCLQLKNTWAMATCRVRDGGVVVVDVVVVVVVDEEKPS